VPTAHTVLEPAATAAAAIHSLWSLLFWTSTAIFVLVLGTLALAARRNGAAGDAASRQQTTLTRSVAAATALTVVILFGFLLVSVSTSHAIASVRPATAITVAITGHQWWWEVEYEEATPVARLRTANEVHIPVGRPVVFKVTSRDVIHSFWVPNLHGKKGG